MTDRSRWLLLVASALLVLVALGAGALVGENMYGLDDLLPALRGEPAPATDVIRGIRFPRGLLAIVVGVALAVAGTLTQTLTRNPLADPGMLGVTAGAAFAITLGAGAGLADGQVGQMLFAFVGAAVTGVAVYAIGRDVPLRLVLAGVALSSVLNGIALGIRLMYPDVFDTIRAWTVGSVAGREQTPMLLPVVVMILGVIGAFLVARSLGAVSLGDDVAHAMGVNVTRARVLVLVLVTLLTGTATAAAGPLAFVGLLVPALARRPSGGSVPWMLALTAVWGAGLLVLGDVVGRVLLPTGEVPLSVVTAFLGGFALIAVVRGGKVHA